MKRLFNELGIQEKLIKALSNQDIDLPTEIQKEAIPLILAGNDVLGQSATGTGKTLAYLLPLIQKVDITRKETQVLILVPTHELAMQVYDQVERLRDNLGESVTSAVIIGNVNINKQVEKLRQKQHIIIGSVSRILKLIQMKKIKAHTLKTIVIDEFDTLLHKNNVKDIEAIIKTTLKDRQLLFFSASINNEAIQKAASLSNNLQQLQLTKVAPLNTSIEHYYFVTELRTKMDLLRKIIHVAKPKKAIIFINKNYDIQKTVAKLQYHHLSVEGIHGDDDKQKRKMVLDSFRQGKVQLLVASDLAARGLDISEVTHIINLDMPENPQDYLHRVGRTGRAGSKGTAISIICNKKEEEQIRDCMKTLKISIVRKMVSEGNIVDNH